MKVTRVILQATCFMYLVIVIAGNDVFTYNQDELQEDNIETMLQNENFIHVSDRRRTAPQSASATQKPDHTPLASSVQAEAYHDIPNGRTELPPDHWKKQAFARDGYQEVYEVTPTTVAKQREEHWVNLSNAFMGEENENDLWLSYGIDESWQQRLERNKRDLTAGSGTQTENVKVQFRVVGLNPNTNRTQIEDSFEKHLQKSLGNSQINVKVTDIASNGTVTFDVEHYEGSISRKDLARAVYDLQSNGLTINGRSYSITDTLVHNSQKNDMEPAVCFLCERYQSCKWQQSNRQWVCRVSDSRLYPYGVDQNDRTLQPDNEFVTQRLKLSTLLVFNGRTFDTIYISVNGIISFGEPYSSYSPSRCPVYNGREERYILAGYWSDLDLLSYDKGRVYYQAYTNPYTSDTKVRNIFDRANWDVILYGGKRNFDARAVIVVTYSEMPPWPARYTTEERVTFQVVIISDGESTYVRYLYAQGAMNFNVALRRDVQICVGRANLDYSRYNYYVFDRVVGNTGELGHWFYLIGYVPSARTKCLQFYQREIYLVSYMMWWNQIVPSCPCNEIFAILSFLWIPSYLQQRCYDMFPQFGQIGRRCCYRLDGSLNFENRIPMAGNLQLYTPYSGYPLYHELYDAAPKQWCCYESNLCNLYYIVRPVRACTGRITWRGFFYGDPHIQTLDSRSFIFNGLGEYRLIEFDGAASDNITYSFKLQGRTCRATTSNGTLTNATIFCALALQNTNGTSVRVSISSSGTYMIIYVDEQDFTVRFRDKSSYNYSTSGGIFMQKLNDSLLVSTPDGIGITVALVNSILEFSVELELKYQGLTKGLLGNFNGNNADDFIFPNGTTLPNNTSERELYEYGKTWAVNDSIFAYGPGENTTTFSDPDFMPIFLDETNSTERADAENICGGSSNLACIFDYIATKNKEIATSTKDVSSTYQNQEANMSNRAPVINGTERLNVTVNKPVQLILTGSDPDNDPISYVLINNPNSGHFNYTNNTIFTANYTPVDLNPVNIAVAAVDNKGLSSEVAEMTLVACSGCSGGNGTCNFEDMINTSNPYYMIATCDCKAPYSGENCEQDKNGCENNPCPYLTTCSDVPASEEELTGQAYNCSDCAPGYTFIMSENSTKCDDVDECNSTNACDANAECTNNIGSYTCRCNQGFRMNSTGSCLDIDECVENQHMCTQICNNKFGSYECACEEGFKLSPLGFNCTKIENFDVTCNGKLVASKSTAYATTTLSMIMEVQVASEATSWLVEQNDSHGVIVTDSQSMLQRNDPCSNLTGNNNCSYGCRNNVGVAQCFCETGYRLAADSYSCDDIDECSENLCSQGCDNTIGSYTCSCFEGFSLAEDKLSCNMCPSNQYGIECNQTCNCRGREKECNNVKGCICIEGWTGQNCDIDIDECDTGVDDCSNDTICTNTNGSFTCDCPKGYNDTYNNGSCFNINECDDITLSECPSDLCVDNPGSFTCLCRVGFEKNTSGICEDIDECKLGISGCEHRCINMEGSFNCECRLGFSLTDDRRGCKKDSDPCLAFNVSCEYACDLVNDSPECYCQLGYVLANNSKTCDDIDECKVNASLCTHTCVNTNGSYNCSCPNGTQLMSDERSCQVCDGYYWGANCAEECACDPKGSSKCDPKSGCVCQPGWEGDKCNEDKDECLNKTICQNSANSTCVNTVGSYVCRCSNGFVLDSSGDCTDIDECKTESPCDQICNNTIGSYICSCYRGFQLNGTVCIDINECDDPSLSKCDQRCRNTLGGFACECFDGYVLNTTTRNTCYRDPSTTTCGIAANCSDICINENGKEVCYCHPGFHLALDKRTCEVCDSGFFGLDCSSECICNKTNTEQCLATYGTYVCYDGWNGTTCSEDIDGCSDPAKNNCQENTCCENIPGSFRCVCNDGSFQTSVGCPDTKAFAVNIKLEFDGSKFNNTPSLMKALEDALLKYGREEVGSSLHRVEVLNITYDNQTSPYNIPWVGTVRAVFYINSSSPNPASDAARLAYNIVRDGITINDTNIKVIEIEIGDKTLGAQASACDIFNKWVNCSSGQSCDETTVTCKATPGDSKTDLIIGLAVGIPLFVLLTTIVAILVCLYVRRKRKSEQQSSSYSIDHEAPFRNVFATRSSTKGSWGAPHRTYAPDTFSETGTNESVTGGLFKTRPKGRSDFQDSAWYDNRGATSADTPESRGTPTGPTSNFSWEYMFKLLEPHKDFEIKRPFYDTSPNPTFSSGSRQPDSAA